MIEDDKLGLKVAENKIEALWAKVKKDAELSIVNLEEGLIINKAMLELSEKKLGECSAK